MSRIRIWLTTMSAGVLLGAATLALLAVCNSESAIGARHGNTEFGDLSRIPEVHFQLEGAPSVSIDSINEANAEAVDHFVAKLREKRPDLAGLPFSFGDHARLKHLESAQFGLAVHRVRTVLREQPSRHDLWNKHLKPSKERFAVAARMQMLAADPALLPGLIEQLAQGDTAEATQALARLAIFSPEDWIRQQALAALQQRDTAPATDILLQGLRYPWPAVVKQSALAVTQLRRSDLMPRVAQMLSEPDPRAPFIEEVNGEKVHVVRELVRINHVRNCLLCHPPATTPNVGFEETTVATKSLPAGPLIGAIPNPNEPAAVWSDPIRPIDLERAVRADITYLRQDFSRILPVADPRSGPALQRFDFLVRKRVLSADEARAHRANL